MSLTVMIAFVVVFGLVGSASTQCVKIANGGFEQDGVAPGNFLNMCPSGWECNVGGSAVVTQGHRSWGGLSSGSGQHYAALRYDVSIKQTLSLEKGVRYSINFLSAGRPGYGIEETFGVYIDSSPIFKKMHPYSLFTRHEGTFIAASTNPTLKFANTEAQNSGSAVFVDDIQICKLEPNCIDVPNGDFEYNENATFIDDTHAPIVPNNWTIKAGTAVYLIRQNTLIWGEANSGSGAFFIGLQQSGTYVEQSFKGLTPGAEYIVTYLAAERAGKGVTEQIVVSVETQGLQTVSDTINPYAHFVEHEIRFVAGQNPSKIRFENADAVDMQYQTVFIDRVRVCEVITTTITPTRTQTTTTQTATTNTKLVRDFDEVREQINSLFATQATMLKTIETLVTQQKLTSEVQKQVTSQVGSISDALALAVKNLPPVSDTKSCNGNDCKPYVRAEGTTVTVQAGHIELQSSCGVIDPCSLMEALNGLRLNA